MPVPASWRGLVGLSPSALSEGVRQAVELQGWKGGGRGLGGRGGRQGEGQRVGGGMGAKSCG